MPMHGLAISHGVLLTRFSTKLKILVIGMGYVVGRAGGRSGGRAGVKLVVSGR